MTDTFRGVIYGECWRCKGRDGLMTSVMVHGWRLREHFLRIGCKIGRVDHG